MNGQQGRAKGGAREWSRKGRKLEGSALRRRESIRDAAISRVFKESRKSREELDNLINELGKGDNQ